MKSFEDSDFVVTFTGESPDSRVIRTWDRVLSYIDYATGSSQDQWTCRNPDDCPNLHDHDYWSALDFPAEDGDRRHVFSEQEFTYCVGIIIVRLTVPVDATLFHGETTNAEL